MAQHPHIREYSSEVNLGGESPLHAVEIGSASLGKDVHRKMESEGSR
jgi:hypothetical protein